ncbi:MAG: hypothetical protein RSB77_04245 [Bacilli bacterium]
MKKKILVLVSMLLLPFVVNAKNNIQLENKINLEGSYKQTTISLAEEINSNASIDSIAFMLSYKINLNGDIEHGIMAAENANIDGLIKKDLFIAANTIDITGTIGKDAYILGNNLKISGTIGGSLKTYGSKVLIENATIKGSTLINAQEIELGKNVKILGKFKYNDDAKIKGLNKSINTETYTNEVYKMTFQERIMNYLISLIALMIIALIIVYLFPKFYSKLDKEKLNFDSIFKNILYGIASLFIIPTLSMFIILTIFGLPLGLIILAVFFIAIYLSKLVTAYIIGKYIYKAIYKTNENIYVSLLIGIVITSILTLNTLLATISLLFGLGILVKNIRK